MSYSRFMSCALFTFTPKGARRSTASRSPTFTRYVRLECPLGNWRTDTGPAAPSASRRNGSTRAGSIRSSSRIAAGWSRGSSVWPGSIGALAPQAGRLRLQASGIERIEQLEPRTDPRQLPAEEVAAGGELAVVEVRIHAALESLRRCQRLSQPHPGHDDVSEGIEIDAGVREAALDV